MPLLTEIKNIKSGKKEINDFALVVAIALLLIVGIKFLKHNAMSWTLCIIALGLLILRYFYLGRKVLLPFQKIWMTFACIMGFFVSRILLSVLFYVVLTPISIIMRIFGLKFLDKSFDKDTSSYWIERKGEYIKEQTETMF